MGGGGGANLSFLRILRMLRLLRLLRLMKSWKGLYTICMAFANAIPQLQNLLVLMVLVNTIFALLGMQLFGGQFTEEKGYCGYSSPTHPAPGGEDCEVHQGGGGHEQHLSRPACRIPHMRSSCRRRFRGSTSTTSGRR